MAYWGCYPEPMNDPEFDKNSDDWTTKEVLMSIASLGVLVLLVWVFSSIS